MNNDLIKDFLKIFITRNKNYNYDKDYALKAEMHAKNKLSIDEINTVKYYLYDKTIPKNLKILDVGCNTGMPLVNFLNQTLDCKGFGIDINKQAIDSFKALENNIFLKLYNGVTIPFEDNYFDHVILHHVIGHVKEPNRILSEINRVLKPGATLSIITPNLWYKFFRFPHNLINNFKPDKSILRYYSKNKLKKALEINQFSNNFFFYFGDDSFFKMNFAKLRICSISKK
jgi:ubiquinone/menaquinone biosynthesis C-methylase UbiE